MLRPDPAQRPRMLEIRDNLISRIEEAERERWRGAVDGLKISLAGAEEKLQEMDRLEQRFPTITLGIPDFSRATARTIETTQSERLENDPARMRGGIAEILATDAPDRAIAPRGEG